MSDAPQTIRFELGAWDQARQQALVHYRLGTNVAVHIALPVGLVLAGAGLLAVFGWPEPLWGRVGFGLTVAGGYFGVQPIARGFTRGFLGGRKQVEASLGTARLTLQTEKEVRYVPYSQVLAVDTTGGDHVLTTRQGPVFLPLVAEEGDVTEFMRHLTEKVSPVGTGG